MYVDFCSPLEPAGEEERKSGGEWKSADVERKMVMLIYPYPIFSVTKHIQSRHEQEWDNNLQSTIVN
jgi:hypothetical protein